MLLLRKAKMSLLIKDSVMFNYDYVKRNQENKHITNICTVCLSESNTHAHINIFSDKFDLLCLCGNKSFKNVDLSCEQNTKSKSEQEAIIVSSIIIWYLDKLPQKEKMKQNTILLKRKIMKKLLLVDDHLLRIKSNIAFEHAKWKVQDSYDFFVSDIIICEKLCELYGSEIRTYHGGDIFTLISRWTSKTTDYSKREDVILNSIRFAEILCSEVEKVIWNGLPKIIKGSIFYYPISNREKLFLRVNEINEGEERYTLVDGKGIYYEASARELTDINNKKITQLTTLPKIYDKLQET